MNDSIKITTGNSGMQNDLSFDGEVVLECCPHAANT